MADRLNAELLSKAVIAARGKHKETQCEGPDAIGAIIPELSAFLDPSRNEGLAPALELLRTLNMQVVFAELTHSEYFVWNAQGICKMTKGRAEAVSFREAIAAFCEPELPAPHKVGRKLPSQFIPYLVSEIERIAMDSYSA